MLGFREARVSRNNDTRFHGNHLSGVISKACNHFDVCFGFRNFFRYVALIAATSNVPVHDWILVDHTTRNDAVGDARVKIDAQCFIVARRRATRLP